MKLNRLIQLHIKSARVIKFDQNDGDGPVKKALMGAGIAGAGAAGLYGLGKAAPGPVMPGGAAGEIGANIAKGAGVVKNTGISAWQALKSKLAKSTLGAAETALSRRERLVQLRAKSEEIIQFGMEVKNGRFIYDGEDRTDEIMAAKKKGEDFAERHPKLGTAAKVATAGTVGYATYKGGMALGKSAIDSRRGQAGVEAAAKAIVRSKGKQRGLERAGRIGKAALKGAIHG